MNDRQPPLHPSRRLVVEQLADLLRSGDRGGVLVLAESGMGKSMVTDGLRDLLDGEPPVSTVVATSSLSGVPFGALGPYLTGLSARAVDSPISIMRHLSARFRPCPDGGLPVVAIDDAHVLDESSAALLAQLAVAGQLRLVVMARQLADLSADLRQLHTDGFLARIDLPPLAESEVQALCESVLEGPVLHSVSAYLTRASAGNPMLAGALLEAAIRNGSLVKRRGSWILVGEFPAADQPLADMIKRELIGLTPEQRRVLELVALADPLPLGIGEQLGHREVIQQLESAHVVAVTDGPQPVVRPRHPLYGEMVRALVPRGRSLLIRQQLMESMDFDQYTVDGLLHHVAWAMDSGVRVPDQQLVRAASLANQLFNSDFAMRAASAVTAAEWVGRAAVETARAHFLRGNTARAIEISETLVASAGQPSVIAAAVLQLAQIHLQTFGLPSALREDARLWLHALDRVETQVGTNAGTRSVIERSRAATELLETAALLLESRFHGLEDRLRAIIERSDRNVACRIIALTQLGEVLAWTGRPESGVVYTAEAFTLVRQVPELTGFHEYVLTRHVIACMHVPSWTDAAAIMQSYAERRPANLLYFGGAVDFVRGLIGVLTSDVDAGLDHLVPAVEALRESDVENALPLALGVTAFAASLKGDAALAGRCREDFEWLPARPDDPKYQLAAVFLALASAPERGVDAAVDDVLTLARSGAASGAVMLEVDTRLFAAFLGPLREPERVRDLTAAVEGRAAALLHDYAVALIEGDPDGLIAVAGDADGLGYALLAMHVRQVAVDLLDQAGHGSRARALAASIPATAGGLGAEPGPAGPDLTRLTRREREIVEHVRRGRSNRQIVTAMGVSVRTIEGHLYRIYPKLNVSGRSALRSSEPTGRS